MNPNEQCRLCNCSFKVKFGNDNISTENLFNPSKRKGCKGEILAQNLQRAGFEVLKCDKHSSRVCNPCARKIRNLGSLYSFVQESLQGKITEFTAATPPKSTSANKRLLDTPEGKSPIRQIGSSVIAGDQNKQGKVFTEIFGICAGKASCI